MSTVLCLACGIPMKAGEVVTPPKAQGGPRVEMFECETPECQRRAAIIFEPLGGMNDDQRSFVEREVARRGAFFPTDWTGGSDRGPKGW